ncbi:MAG: phytanoyl-CoA dioxygenase family protein [Burkholderiales bacterium]
MTRALSATELEAYRRDGFLVCRFPLFDAAALASLDAIAQEYQRDVAAGRRPADLNVPHFGDPRLFDWLMAPAALDIVEPVLGPDIALWTSQFFLKAPREGRAIGWHADGRYWQGYLDPVEVASIWLALDAADAGNGALRVVRGSHRRRDFRYVPRDGEDNPFFPVAVAAEEIDPADLVTIELARGEFVLFDAWLVHGSEANRSERARRGFTLRYMPTTSRFHPLGRSGAAGFAKRVLAPVVGRLRGRPVYEHRIYLARGADRAGNRYGARPPEASVSRTPSESPTLGA